jgi:DNA end-binding protein Ku
MPRALWKGAITFGLVHIPVALYPAARENRVDFDWLDRKTMKPVGYKRVNKVTGKEVAKEDIVKGIEVEDGHYVVLTDEEIKAARPEKTQTVDILAFVQREDIAPKFFDSPYVLAPTGRGEKVYLLLREAL